MAGYGDGEIAPSYVDGLFASSSDLKFVPVVLHPDTVDAGNTDNPLRLRKGLVLALHTASGQYKQYDNDAADGTEDEEDALVLIHEIYMAGDAETVNVATGLFEGTVNEDMLVWKDTDAAAAFDFTAVTRILKR